MNVTGAKNYNPLGYEALAPTSATKMDVPNGAKYALITIEVQPVRMTDDGTTPTLTVGMVLPKDVAPFWYAGNLSKVQFFNDTAGGLVKILYYG
jgi:hypothetical protein